MYSSKLTYVLRHHTNLAYHANTHSNYEIIAVTSGTLLVCVSGTDIPVNKGEAIFLPPYFVHSFKTEKNSESYIWEFSSSLIPERLPDDIILFSIPGDSQSFFFRTEDTDNNFAQKAAIYHVLSMMCEENIRTYSMPPSDVCSGAVRFISENFSHPITLQDASKQLCVNYSYLSRVFKECQGLSFTECLNGTRLNRAVALLVETNQSVTEIALSCGFGSVRNFNRLFSQKMKCSPYEFRKKYTSVNR